MQSKPDFIVAFVHFVDICQVEYIKTIDNTIFLTERKTVQGRGVY